MAEDRRWGPLGLTGLGCATMIRLPAGTGQREPPIFSPPDLPELINIQSVSGEAKPYQIRQFLRLVERYNLKLED